MPGYPKEWEKKVTLNNGQQVLLRPEMSTDTKMLLEMFSSLSDATLDNYVLPFTRERIERWTSNIDYNKNLTILSLVKEEGKHRIIGSASLFLNSFEALKHKAELGITVHDDYQNMGLGTTMINHLLNIARRKGLKKVYLQVNTHNSRAIRVYEKCGFQIEANLIKEYYRRGQFGDQYRMAIFL